VSYPQTCDECLASGKCLAVPVLTRGKVGHDRAPTTSFAWCGNDR
jgi:hypothetical protein